LTSMLSNWQKLRSIDVWAWWAPRYILEGHHRRIGKRIANPNKDTLEEEIREKSSIIESISPV
jgi:hypothetical protein